MRELDRSRPYAEICGLPGAAYEQDGFRFKPDGTEAVDVTPIIEEIWVSEKEVNPPSSPVIEIPSPPPETPKTLEDMHWKHIKAMVEAYGGEWAGKAEGIAFLQGKGSDGLAS